MKIHFNPKEFLRQFKIAASVVSTKDIKPSLCSVKVVADKNDGVVLMATDSEVGIRIRVDADVSKNGRLVLESTKTGMTVTREYGVNEQWGLDRQVRLKYAA